jgi:hypothetical protein
MDGMRASIILDSNGTDLAIAHRQDVTAILDRNAELRTQEQRSDWGRHIATIPNAVYVQWWDELYRAGHTKLKIFSKEFNAIVRKKLHDPEWAHLRTDCKNSTIGYMRERAAWSAGFNQ